jgi:hypothetical protein
MTPAEAIAAAELAEAEIRYRNQAAREMYARDGQAERAAAWQRSTAPVVHGTPPPSSRNGGGDEAAGLTSPTCGPATSPPHPPAGTRARAGGRMTCHRMTPEEIDQANAEFRQWRLPVLTLGLIPEPEPEMEARA